MRIYILHFNFNSSSFFNSICFKGWFNISILSFIRFLDTKSLWYRIIERMLCYRKRWTQMKSSVEISKFNLIKIEEYYFLALIILFLDHNKTKLNQTEMRKNTYLYGNPYYFFLLFFEFFSSCSRKMSKRKFYIFFVSIFSVVSLYTRSLSKFSV